MNIASPAGLTLGDWLALAARAWLARHPGQLAFVPVRRVRRTISSAPRFSLAVAMGDKL